ncbi:hypothetical protein D9M72_73680 [compost metagenome]
MPPVPGSIDPDTNALFVTDRPVPEYVAWALRGRLPLALLPTVLHEATHHWCLSGCVGHALAALSFESQEAYAASPLFPLYCDEQVVAQWETVDFARRLLEPLLEGMAMFAEFDVYPGPSPVLSTVLGMLARLFPPEEGNPAENALDCLCRRLAEYRQSEAALRKKSGLLVQPFGSGKGGYLLGYLCVKTLWLQARRRAPSLRDADLFLQYLRNLVFDDAGFVAHLLDAGTREEPKRQTRFRLVRHLNARLKLMASADLAPKVAAMEAALSAFSDLDGHRACLYLDDREAEQVSDRLQQRLRALVPEMKTVPGPALDGMTRMEKLRAIREFTQRLDAEEMGAARADPAQLQRMVRIWAHLLHRPIVRLRVDEVDCEVGGDGMCAVSAQGEPVFSVTAAAQRKAGSRGRASLALYYLPDEFEIALVCLDGEGVLFARFGESVSSLARAGYEAAIGTVLGDQARRDTLSSCLRAYADAGVDGEAPQPGEAGTDMIESVYFDRALCFVADADLEACAQKLQASGLWRILDEDGENVNAMAAVGLAQSWASDPALLREILRQRAVDPDRVVAMLARAQARHGLPLVDEGSRRLFI